MYAIVDIAGQQFKVEKDQRIFVHRLENKEGSKIDFNKVLLLDTDKKVLVGEPLVKGALVVGKVISHTKGDKVQVFKKKRRKGFKVLNGHRQHLTEVQIENILEKAPAKKEPAAKTAAAKTGTGKPAASQKPQDRKTTGKKEPEKKAAEKKSSETKKPAAKKTAEKKPAAKKAAEKKTPEKKTAKAKTTEKKEPAAKKPGDKNEETKKDK